MYVCVRYSVAWVRAMDWYRVCTVVVWGHVVAKSASVGGRRREVNDDDKETEKKGKPKRMAFSEVLRLALSKAF